MALILSPRLCKEVTSRFYEILESGNFNHPIDLIPFEFEVSSHAFLWASCEQFCTQELISMVNVFIHELCKLQILEEIIKDYENKEQATLRHELTRIPLYFCLRQPNEYRNRTIYLVSHLCHHANLETEENYSDDFPDDKDIIYRTLEKVSKPWASSTNLISALDLVGNRSKEFKDATDDYRDKANHRQPPPLEIGLKASVKRIRGDELASDSYFLSVLNMAGQETPRFVYTPHAAKPLKFSEMLPILVNQALFMKDVFYKYWDLVLEQARALL